MTRIQTYDSAPRRIQAGNVDPGFRQPVLRSTGGTAEDKTLSALLDGGLKLTDLAVREYVGNQTARVSQSLLRMNEELAAERDRYMQEHQGENALDAGAHFESFARQTAQKHLAEGKFQGRFAQDFLKQAAGTALHFTEQGRSYAAGQRAAWLDSRLKGELAEFQNQVAQNYDNKDWIEFNLNNLAERVEAMRPGLDNRALLDGARRDAALTIVDGFLGDGRIRDAQGAYARYEELLGDQAPEIKTRIQARAEALAAQAEAERRKAEAEAEKTALKGAVDGILADVAAFPTLEERKEAAFARADALPDPALRDKARTEIKQEMAWRETRRDATTAREKRQFQELARQQGWTPWQAADQLDKAEGLSERAREDLRNDFDGRAERQTPANKAALAELRTLIDLGPERGGIDPKDADAIDAYVYRHGLTYEQGLHAHKYAEQGGMAGEVTQTQINRVFMTLFPKLNAKDVPGDLFDLVGAELKRAAPGKAATDAEVRSALARLYVEGETEGAGWFTWGVGKDETRMEALRQGRGKNWSPDGEVPAEDTARIETLLRESGVEPTPGRVRRYYWEEQGGKA